MSTDPKQGTRITMIIMMMIIIITIITIIILLSSSPEYCLGYPCGCWW